MSTKNKTQAQAEAPTNGTTPQIKTIRDAVAERLGGSSEATFNAVVQHFYQREFERRSNAIVKVVELLNTAEVERRKFDKPDASTYGADGKEIVAYTAANRKSAKEADERIEKLNRALEAAFDEKPDFSKVLELGK